MPMASPVTPPIFLAGTNGAVSITIAAVETEFNVKKADWTVEVGEEDVTHSGANGFYVPLGSVRKISGTLTFIYDLANPPAAATPYDLKVATTAALKLYGNAHQAANLASGSANSSEVWSGPAFIKQMKFQTGPDAKTLECSCEFVSSGAWTGPGL